MSGETRGHDPGISLGPHDPESGFCLVLFRKLCIAAEKEILYVTSPYLEYALHCLIQFKPIVATNMN